jgi:hypothetical protein
MPKNFKPSFKQYLSAPSSVVLNQEVGHDHDHRNEQEGLGVSETIARHRAATAGPSTIRGRRGGWITDTSCMPLHAAWPELDDPNSNTTRTQPRRRAAGPSAPPSWQTPPKVNNPTIEPEFNGQRITRDDLNEASSLFTKGRINISPVKGVRDLSHYIYRSVLQHLDCPDIYWTDGVEVIRYDGFYRDYVRIYREDFKIGLLGNHASYPTPRLSNESIKAILSPPVITDDNDEDDWDTGPLTERIHHLGITLHPDPYRLLKSINPLPTVALTSLDLAYSIIPQVEKLVDALPRGLKELGMVGIKCTSEAEFTRMLGLLGKRLILLHVSLILSCSKIPIGRERLKKRSARPRLDSS